MADPATMPAELSAAVRIAHGIEPSEPVNERFADYVASTAFSLSLSRNMVLTFLSLAHAIEMEHERSRRPLHDGALTALERRGLIVVTWAPRDYCDDAKDCPRWSNTATITTAGKLVLQLLAEAGQAPRIITPMPPPPPGWTDPRPKIDIGRYPQANAGDDDT
jgi:hypothetical protein